MQFIFPLPFDKLCEATKRWSCEWETIWHVNEAKVSENTPELGIRIFEFHSRLGKLGEFTIIKQSDQETSFLATDPKVIPEEEQSIPPGPLNQDEYKNYLLGDTVRDYLTELVSEGTLDLRWLGEDFIMGFLASTDILNEELRVIPIRLYKVVEEQFLHFPFTASSMNHGSLWHYTAEVRDNLLEVNVSLVDAELSEIPLRVKKIRAEWERVGYISARQLTDYTSRVIVMAESNHPEIIGHLVDVASSILHVVKGIDTEEWRKSTRAKLIPKKKQKNIPVGEDSEKKVSAINSSEFEKEVPSQITNVVNIAPGAQVGQLAVGHNIEQKKVTHENPGPALVWTHEPVSEWEFRSPRKIPLYMPSVEEKIFIKFSEPFLGKRPYDLIQACHDFFDEWVEHREWNSWFQVKPNSGESFDSYKSSLRLVGRCDECLTREINGQILEFNGSKIYAEVMIEARAEKLVISASPFHWACLEEAWEIFRQFLQSEGLIQPLQDSHSMK